MDALGVYGSDSSDTEEPVVSPHVAKASKITSAPGTGSSLPSSTTLDEKSEVVVPEATKEGNPLAAAASANDVATTPSSRKRRRRWDIPVKDDLPPRKSDGLMSSPQLGSTSSLVYWDKDYLCSMRCSSNCAEPLTESQQQHLTEKLNQLHASISVPTNGNNATGTGATPSTPDTSTSSWALHLKRQQEFHNPHFLNSVISHFGLNVLGSNIPQKDVVEEFEYNLVALEEEARYRMQQQLQFQPSTGTL